jgi:hypothetical protein
MTLPKYSFVRLGKTNKNFPKIILIGVILVYSVGVVLPVLQVILFYYLRKAPYKNNFLDAVLPYEQTETRNRIKMVRFLKYCRNNLFDSD